MVAFIPPALFVLSWIFALLGSEAPGTDSATAFDENALRWILFLGMGWTAVGAAIPHTVFARQTAASIGWQTNGFQYEVGFANLAVGLAGIYAANQDSSQAWIAAAIAGGVFLTLAAANHIREIFTERNFAPGNTAILISDLGVPISLLALLLATNAI